MSYPAFFDEVASITLSDPLAEILGAAADGLIEYRCADRGHYHYVDEATCKMAADPADRQNGNESRARGTEYFRRTERSRIGYQTGTKLSADCFGTAPQLGE